MQSWPARDGILRSDDLGKKWVDSSRGLGIRYVRWLATHPQVPGLVFAGTEPAGIYISSDDGVSWDERPEVFELRERGGWSLPYSPAAGCVRGFAFHGQRVYGAAEVGGVLRSTDGGKGWEMANGISSGWQGRVNTDVHSIEVHLSSPELVYAPTGGGFYRSWDGGESWEQRYSCYCRAAWVDSDDPEHLILGPADHVDRGGRIEESLDGGQGWQAARGGLETPWPRHMVERFYQIDDQLLAVLSNGELLACALNKLSWEKIQAGSGEVRAVTWIME
ncbi:MAG: hypothetical protein A2Z16_04545 [Chloroflexi bacterium RBG_16_54_18]|nr:MAG: hypothetical protein A2Z16_04545 [Chloroflexi bacterium RBG_16_54_18]